MLPLRCILCAQLLRSCLDLSCSLALLTLPRLVLCLVAQRSGQLRRAAALLHQPARQETRAAGRRACLSPSTGGRRQVFRACVWRQRPGLRRQCQCRRGACVRLWWPCCIVCCSVRLLVRQWCCGRSAVHRARSGWQWRVLVRDGDRPAHNGQRCVLVLPLCSRASSCPVWFDRSPKSAVFGGLWLIAAALSMWVSVSHETSRFHAFSRT